MVRAGFSGPFVSPANLLVVVGGAAGLLVATPAAVTPAFARDFWQMGDGDGYYRGQYYFPPAPSYPGDYYDSSPRRGYRDDGDFAPRVDYLKAKTAEQLRKAPVPPPTKGPLMVVVSIAKQQLTLYDDGVAIAHSRISTGIPGHPTPTGIFSVIQKSRWHRSNLYSDAPMPFMQRITWSGVALHAGVVPGHPASHGCIRMPTDFAIRMWRTTQNGARVVVVKNDIAPAEIAHPALFKRVLPVAVPPAESAPPPDARLRPSLETSTSEISARKAAPDPKSAPQKDDTPPAPAAPAAGEKRSDIAAPVKVAEATGIAVMRGGRIETDAPVASDQPPPEAAALRAPSPSLIREVPPAASAAPETAQDDAARDTSAPPEVAQQDLPAQAPAADNVPATASVNSPSADAPAEPSITVPLIAPAPPPKLDAVSLPGSPASGQAPASGPAATPSPAAPIPGEATTLRKGPISVFISRKEGRLYVRKGFAPVFDVPVTIADANKPIGTHVFTALALKADGTTMRWNVLTVPEGPQKPAPAPRVSGRHKHKSAVEAAAPVSPTASAKAALDRITIPENARARISELMTVGASLIVSDEGLGPETGKETDFVVLTKN